jgi:exosome complex RNA-binding protein Csl4
MKKINIFLLILVVMMIAATFYKDSAIAAQVTRINTNRGLIVIDGSKDDGFIMGATVCFYSASGEEITCGRVQQTSESYATVKVNNREAKKIKNGMEAIIPVEKSDEEVTKEDKDCVDDSDCGDAEVCINGRCRKTK